MPDTNDNLINIAVETNYILSESDPGADKYIFSYTITIQNHGKIAAQLLSRHWVITDGDGNVQEVTGDGVVGEQPLIKPGEGFQYTSGTLLNTPVGTMQGSYQMTDSEGKDFKALIKPFTLSTPGMLH